jgi:hypothetical protein
MAHDDEPAARTAMATGSDSGSPGETSEPPPTPEDLAALRAGADEADVVGRAAEDDPRTPSAADDDRPIPAGPARRGAGGGTAPEFREPPR